MYSYSYNVHTIYENENEANKTEAGKTLDSTKGNEIHK